MKNNSIILALALSFLLFYSQTAHTTDQIFVGGPDFSFDNANPDVNFLFGSDYPWNSGSAAALQVLPTSGTFSNLRAHLPTAPGSGNSVAFTVVKSDVDQALTCTISGTNTSCADTTNSFTISAGEDVVLRASPTSSPTASAPNWTVKFTPDTTKYSVLFGVTLGAGDDYLAVYTQDSSSVEAEEELLLPVAGTVRSLYVELTTAPNTGNSRTYTLRKNQTNTSLTCTVSGTGTTCNDTSNTVSVAVGDVINILYTVSGTPDASSYQHSGIVLETSTDGQFIYDHTHDTNFNTAVTKYIRFNVGANYEVSDAKADQLAQSMTFKKIYVDLDVAPGAGNS